MCLNWKHTPIASHGISSTSGILDSFGCGLRADCLVATQKQQPHPTPDPRFVFHQAGKVLDFKVGTVFVPVFSTKPRDADAKQFVAEQKTLASIDQQVDAWHAAQPKAPDPVIIEHPIDPVLQTGDSALLGGGMSIHAPWKRD